MNDTSSASAGLVKFEYEHTHKKCTVFYHNVEWVEDKNERLAQGEWVDNHDDDADDDGFLMYWC